MTAHPGSPTPARRTLLRSTVAAATLGAAGWSTVSAAQANTRRPPGSSLPLAAEPRIYSTAEWGARPPSDKIKVLNHVPTYIVVHHTAEPGNSEDYSLAHAMEICRAIQNFHMDGNGWADTGQQFTNSRGGFVLEGRHKSLDVVRGGTRHVQGANVGGHNSEVIGIENEGLYTQVDVPPALWDSLVALVAWIASQYGRPVANILGHRDFNSTECPGNVLYGRLQELREAVAGVLGLSLPAALATWPLLRPGSVGAQVRAAQHLLRAKGFPVRADGVFGPATKEAVARLAAAHGIEQHVCAAIRHRTVDETGYLGSDIWPLLTPRLAEGEHSEVGKAVSALRRAGGRRVTEGGLLTPLDWKRLLA